jgi:hypothetical protein
MISPAPTIARNSKSSTKNEGSDVGRGSEVQSSRSLGNLQIQRMCKGCAKNLPHVDSSDELEKEEAAGSMMRKEAGPSAGNQAISGSQRTQVSDVVQTAGQPLDSRARTALEPRFDRDFGNVRVHTDHPACDSAKGVNARAYTVGHHVVFGSGEYEPGTKEGQNLLAHELTHVVQQQGGVHLKGEIGQEGDPYEREADAVAAAVTEGRSAHAPIRISSPSPSVQRKEKEEDHRSEMLPQFATRVRDHAATRLTRNIGVLDEWRTFVEQIQGLQLQAQMLVGMVNEYAAIANQMWFGDEVFERGVTTHSAGLRAKDTSKLDRTATYESKNAAYLSFLWDEAYGYQTTPSIVEKLQVMSGEIKAEDLEPSHFVHENLWYHNYRGVLGRIKRHEGGACQACHDLNFARQQTIDEFGDPEPSDPIDESILGPQASMKPGLMGMGDRDRATIEAFLEGTPLPQTPAPQKPQPSPPSKYPEHEAFTPTTHWRQDPNQLNPFVPQAATPKPVDTPPPRTDLCGELTAAKDSARVPHLEFWGYGSAQIAEIISHIDAVLTPLGPRGYRVLGPQDFDALYAVSPGGMENVRAQILSSIEKRKQDYADLRAKILAGEVPYQELCPIVDELLPSTNEFVQDQALIDIHAEQRKQQILAAIELTLIGLSLIFPPAGALAAGVGVLAGINQVKTGIEQIRQGEQWTQGTGAGIYSHAQEAEAPGLEGQGWLNIATGSIGMGLSAFQIVGAIARAQRAAFLKDALENGFAFGSPSGTGLVILGKGNRLVLIAGDTQEVVAVGAIGEQGPEWTMLSEPYPFYRGAAPSGVGDSAMVPYGGSSAEPFSVPGEEIVMPDGTTVLMPAQGPGVPVGEFGTPSPTQEIVLPDGNTLIVPGPASAGTGTALVPYGPTAMVPYQGPVGSIPSFAPGGPFIAPWAQAGSMVGPLASVPQVGGFMETAPSSFMTGFGPPAPTVSGAPGGGISSIEIGPSNALTPEDLINSHVILPRAELMSSPASYQMEIAQELATIEQARMQGPISQAMTQRYNSLTRTYLHSYLGPNLDFLGIPVGQGYSTFAAIQVVGPDGKILAIARGMYGAGLHAEEAALAILDRALPATLPKGSYMQIGVDQTVCADVCIPAITNFAEQRGLSYVDSFVPQRETLPTVGTENPVLASPKTTAKTALRGNSPPFQITQQRIYQGEQ